MKKTRISAAFFLLVLLSLVIAAPDSGLLETVSGIRNGFSLTGDRRDGADRLDRLDLFRRVLHQVNEKYVDPSRVNPGGMFKAALENVSAIVPEVLVRTPGPRRVLLTAGDARLEFDSEMPNLFAVHSAVTDALKFVRANRAGDVEDRELEEAAIVGALGTLDPHTVFLNERMMRETKVETVGEFGGLGIEIGIRDSKLTVIAPIKDSPAALAGLKAADHITKIGKESTVNMDLTEAVSKLRGPKGVPVTISVMREGYDAERSFTIVRDIIKVAAVESELLPGGVGYVELKKFQRDSSRHLSEHLGRLSKAAGGELSGLILDVRNDPGGILEEAIAVTDLFLNEGVIVVEVGMKNRMRLEHRASKSGTEPYAPMVVLVNEGTASASEIVAGALERNDRAVIMGRPTFGKATVQSLVELPGNTGLKMTIRQYLMPGDISIQSKGIIPDVALLPARIETNRISLFPSPRKSLESTLQHHLESPDIAKDGRDSSLVAVRYLEPEIPEGGSSPRPAPKTPRERTDRILEDFAVRSAHDLLVSNPGTTRARLLESAAELASSWEREEFDKISKSLAERGIDWTEPPSETPGNCRRPTAWVKVGDGKETVFSAGRDVGIEVTLKNPGPCALYRAWAKTEAENFFFNDREFHFGKIAPNTEVTRRIEIKLPKSLPDTWVDLSLAFYEGRGFTPDAQSASLAVRAAEPPRLAFLYDVKDGGTPESFGNGNGLIEPGETVELRLLVRNEGKAQTKEAYASLKNLSGEAVLLKRGRVPFPDLAVEASTSLSFLFDVKPNAPAGPIELELSLIDLTYRLMDKVTFRFDAVDTAKVREESGWIVVEGEDVPVKGYPSPGGTPLGKAGRGVRLAYNQAFGDYFRVELPSSFNAWLPADSVEVSAPPPDGQTQAPDVWIRPPSLTLAKPELAFKEVPDRFLKVSGWAADDRQVRHLLIYVNEKKVFYKSFASTAPWEKQPFEASVPLEAGVNRITVMARDDQGLFERASLVVRRPAGGESALLRRQSP